MLAKYKHSSLFISHISGEESFETLTNIVESSMFQPGQNLASEA
jgi:hypothetical protein